MEARCAATIFMVRDCDPRGALHGVGGEHSAIDRRARTGIRAYVDGTSPARWPGAVVLRLEGALAVEPDVHLSSLEDRCGRVVAISLPAGTGGAGNCSSSARSQDPRTAGRLSDFRRHALSRTRVLQHLSFSLLLRCRPLP